MHKDDLKVCNCSVCGVLLCGLEHQEHAKQHGLSVVAGRIRGRPLCPKCIETNSEPMTLVERALTKPKKVNSRLSSLLGE
jgi:hypothetical protein